MTPRTTSFFAAAAVLVALTGLVIATTESSDARRLPGASTKPRKFGILRLNKKKQFPASVIPKVKRARFADRVGGKSAKQLTASCGETTVDIGTYCVMSNPYPLEAGEVGKNNYFFATRKCAQLGGYLPSAAELIGAADRVRLASRVDDDELNASTDVDNTDGLKDRREMSSTLTTTASGSRAAGSEGVSDLSRGDPRTGEPNPVPQPANPSPDTLQYVTVYDNRDFGGFAGSKPVGSAEIFRCAFQKAQGGAGDL
jgi:hypothetical protein